MKQSRPIRMALKVYISKIWALIGKPSSFRYSLRTLLALNHSPFDAVKSIATVKLICVLQKKEHNLHKKKHQTINHIRLCHSVSESMQRRAIRQQVIGSCLSSYQSGEITRACNPLSWVSAEFTPLTASDTGFNDAAWATLIRYQLLGTYPPLM